MSQIQPQKATDVPLIVADPLVYDIPTYCRAHLKSRSSLYAEWARGEGPDFFREGGRIKITGEAAARHRAKLEAKARAEREARARAIATPDSSAAA